MTLYEILTSLIAVVTAITVIVQLGLTLQSIRADHERRKKQATLEFVQAIRPAWFDARHALEAKWGNQTLNAKEIDEIEADFDLLQKVRTLLGLLEHMSVGMNSGIFDKDLLYRMSGGQLITIYRRFQSYIERVQQQNPLAYTEYQQLAREFEERRLRQPTKKGNIRYS